MHFNQAQYDVRCEWGIHGLRELAAASDAIIIVDVLSFSTCVDVAVSRGAAVYPYPWRDPSAKIFARQVQAELAGPRAGGGPSLSPASLLMLGPGDRVVLPSPNGSSLSVATGDVPTYTGCLRNARAVAREAMRDRRVVSVIPAGERWPDGSLRAALEDWLGAGAIVSHLEGSKSPEAAAAEAMFRSLRARLCAVIAESGSGRELQGQGYGRDLQIACELLVSPVAPRLVDGAYVSIRGKEVGEAS